MTEFLTDLASLTIGGTVAVVVMALAARMSRARYAARWRCWLWLLLSLRLLIPLSISLPEQTEIRAPIQITAPSDIVIYEENEPESLPAPEPEKPVEPTSPVPVPSVPTTPTVPSVVEPEKQITLYQIVFAVWAAGAILVLLWYLFSHWRFLRWLRRWGDPVLNAGTIRLFNELGDKLELNRRPEVLVCTGLKVPVLAGVFAPKLLLPEGEMGQNALRYSLLHELTHFKRRDIWLKTLALLVNAVHWFNPFMWYMTRLVERDTELACDEAALKLLPAEEHKAYGTTILDAVERLKAAQ